MKMKKMIAVLLSALLCVLMFAGCSAENADEVQTDPTSSTEPTTDSAVIKEADAINLIKTYTAEELGLEGSLDDYSIMVAGNGIEINGEYYVKVIAGQIAQNEGSDTYSIAEVGRYFISYDGETMLSYDEENDSYTPFAEIHDLPEKTEHTHE